MTYQYLLMRHYVQRGLEVKNSIKNIIPLLMNYRQKNMLVNMKYIEYIGV